MEEQKNTINVPAKKYKILFVDDDNFLLNMYSLKFTKEGMDVVTINDPLTVIDKLKEGLSPDIVVLDIVMPSLDGIELLKKIRDAKLIMNAVFIILTNQGQQSDIERTKELNVAGYIVKATTIPSEVLSEVVRITKEVGK